MSNDVHRLSAFTLDPSGGNPAGVWIGETLPSDEEMLAIAADVGYSETAFVAPRSGTRREIRYFSPVAEVPFCGHATIATGVVLGREAGAGTYDLATTVGVVPVEVTDSGGVLTASLTSVEPRSESVPDSLLERALGALGWDLSELDSSIEPALAFAGAWHLVLAASERSRLDDLDYDFDALLAVMSEHTLTTVQLVWRADATTFRSRNPFPVGGVVEDPATGAAAAALGGHLRHAGLVDVPATVTVHQGEAMGRPSLLTVDIGTSGGIVVTGTAVAID